MSSEDGPVVGENRDYRFFKKNAAVMIAQGDDSNEVVVEVGHNVPGGCVEVGEEDVTGDGGAAGCAAGGADNEL